jgi:tetratricopeptide (TPR) repeat protein
MSKARRKSLQKLTKSRPDLSDAAAPRSSRLDQAIYAGLVLAILIVYAQVGNFEFTTYDDGLYVEDPHVQAGLTIGSIGWAFTAVVANNWIPVTLVSHVIDGQLFHMHSGMHHLMNVVFHALATLLLFACLRRATGSRWPSAAVALLFALHPLHISSVAWVAERKDVLSALFFFLAIYAYQLYVERPSPRGYLLVAGAFSLGLMAKPMLVTFPFVLLLLDFWPLQRFQWPRSVWEKVPLLALFAIASGITFSVQKSTGAVLDVPFAVRLQNALISYVAYIGQMFWPAGLAVIYPYRQSIPAWQSAAALALLLAVSGLALSMWKTRRYFAMGWFWYLGMLVPVIGLVQVGLQSHADRYTYLPMVGLFVILAWGAAEILEKWPGTKQGVLVTGAIAGAAWVAVTWTQIGYWQNSETLFQHAIDVTGDNWAAQYNLGHYLMDVAGRVSDAVPHFQEAVRLNPTYAEAHNNLGAGLMNTARNSEAITQFEAALRIKPDFADAQFNLGLALSKVPGRAAEAIQHYREAIRLNPEHDEAHGNLAVLLVSSGHNEEAVAHLETALRLHPDYKNEFNLGAVLASMPGKQAEALAHLQSAQRMHPDAQTAQFIERLRAGGH